MNLYNRDNLSVEQVEKAYTFIKNILKLNVRHYLRYDPNNAAEDKFDFKGEWKIETKGDLEIQYVLGICSVIETAIEKTGTVSLRERESLTRLDHGDVEQKEWWFVTEEDLLKVCSHLREVEGWTEHKIKTAGQPETTSEFHNEGGMTVAYSTPNKFESVSLYGSDVYEYYLKMKAKLGIEDDEADGMNHTSVLYEQKGPDFKNRVLSFNTYLKQLR